MDEWMEGSCYNQTQHVCVDQCVCVHAYKYDKYETSQGGAIPFSLVSPFFDIPHDNQLLPWYFPTVSWRDEIFRPTETMPGGST